MRLKAKRSPEGSSPNGGKLRLTILLGALAALMLVPAAQALASGSPGHTKVNLKGTGSGEISSVGGIVEEGQYVEEYEGVPPIECSYTSPGPATGHCEDTTDGYSFLGSTYAVFIHAIPAPGSYLALYTTQKGPKAGEWCGVVLGHGHGPTGAEEPPAHNYCNILTKEGVDGNEGEITATFCLEGEIVNEAGQCVRTQPLTTNIEEGSGTVVSNPAGIECTGSAPHSCTTEEIAEGETVTLTASPAAGYQFKSWKYCDSGGVHGRQCTITLTAGHKPVGAKFAAANDVSVSKAGNGTGAISGVTCGNTCTAATGSILASKAVTLKAKPYVKNSEFKGWTASPVSCTLSEEGKTCSLGTLGANETVEAEFAEQARENLTVAKSGSGQGAVKSAPAGINCSYTCGSNTAYFYKGTSVTLTAEVQAGKGSALGNWGGACSGSEATPCTVSMSAAKSVTAEFK